MDAASKSPASQTLSRGIRVLEILADARRSLTVDEVSTRLGVHRSIAYRLIRTLESHGLVVRDAAGRIDLGARLAALAAGVAHDLQAEALPELTAAANDLAMTCFLAVLDHDTVLDRDECVTLVSIEPRHAIASVAQRPGTRHPITVGAPGKAILATLPRESWPEDLAGQLDHILTRGWAESHDEVIPSLHSVAVPLTLRGRAPAAIAVVSVTTDQGAAAIADRLARSASVIRDALGG